jgi:hypothetical protein
MLTILAAYARNSAKGLTTAPLGALHFARGVRAFGAQVAVSKWSRLALRHECKLSIEPGIA